MTEEKKREDNNAFCEIDKNTICLVTNSYRGLVRSYIHLWPEQMIEAFKKSSVEVSTPEAIKR
jgi:hypothetical protein